MTKTIFAVLFLAVALIFSACPANTDDGGGEPEVVVKTGKVTFLNESSYKVVVHQNYFSGPVLLELNAGLSNKNPVEVRISDNYGVGSTFSIEYLYRINDGFDTESGEVIASGIDPNVQINFVVEENKSYTKQIPQPTNLEFQTAFIKILNSAALPFELRYLGTAFKQTGNGNLSVAPGKTGVYKLDGIPEDGKEIQSYEAVSTFKSVTVPAFTARKGVVYEFEYDGNLVKKIKEYSIVFK